MEEALSMLYDSSFDSGGEEDFEECEDFPLPLSYEDYPEDLDPLVPSDITVHEDVDPLVPPERTAGKRSESERERGKGSDGGKGRGRGRGKGKERVRKERQNRRVLQSQQLQWEEADEASDCAPAPFSFVQKSGPQTPLPPDAKPIAYWKLFFDDSIFDLLVEETNR